MEEREDTELLRELLPRFISSCSVWRLQLSVLNVFIFYDRTEVVGWQSSYRISHNNNLKLQQYWQNIVLNGSYSKQTSHFDSNFLLCVLWSVSEFYLGLVGPHCSFLTNISFSLICFLFRVIIVISRHFLQHNMPQSSPHLAVIFVRQSPWPGLAWLPGWTPQVGWRWLHCSQATPQPALVRLALIAAGRGLPWQLPVVATGNIEQQVWR